MAHASSGFRRHDPVTRRVLLVLAWAVFGLVFLVPLLAVFGFALGQGVGTYARLAHDSAFRSAVTLTLTAAAVSVPVNILFGLAASWCLARFDFWGRSVLLALLDLPLTVSPVVAGLMLVLLFGAHSPVGAWLIAHDLRVVFATPGIILATVFVTFPFVARELIPLMQAQGADEELAALTLGAPPWTMFLRITLPKISLGLLYGVILCNARAMGEFGAVSVVSGHIRGRTNTLPLHVEVLYNEYDQTAAFAAASLLALLGIVTLILKRAVGQRIHR